LSKNHNLSLFGAIATNVDVCLDLPQTVWYFLSEASLLGPLVVLEGGNMVHPTADDSGHRRTDFAQRLENRLATLKSEYDKG
jgi:hypothetical protein